MQSFPNRADGTTLTVGTGAGTPNTGVDTSNNAIIQSGIAVGSDGALTVNVLSGGVAVGGWNGMTASANGALTITNNGTVESLYAVGLAAGNVSGDLTIHNNGTVSGARHGIQAYHNGSGSLVINTGEGSKTTAANSSANLPVYYGDPFAVPTQNQDADMDGQPDTELVLGGVGLLASSGPGGGSVTVSTGADSLVSGLTGILAVNDGNGSTVVEVGAGGRVLGGRESATATGGVGLEALSGANTTGLRIETGAGSIVGGDLAEVETDSVGVGIVGIVGTFWGDGQAQIITGESSRTGGYLFGILAQSNNPASTFEVSTGSYSSVDGGVVGVAVVGVGDYEIETGESSNVEGDWSGITTSVMGNVDITTGAESTVVGNGGLEPGDIPPILGVPIMLPPGVDTVPATGITVLAGHQNPGENTVVNVTTGEQSLVAGNGAYANGIFVSSLSLDTATTNITTGDGSIVRGGDEGLVSTAGIGGGIGILALSQGLERGETFVTTGTESLVEGAAAGIVAYSMSALKPVTVRVVTGEYSTVRSTASPNHVVQPGVYDSWVATGGIVASGFGAIDSTVEVVTGENSLVEGANFGIQATSGTVSSAVSVKIGEGSVVRSTEEARESYYADGNGNMVPMGEFGYIGGQGLSSGINVTSIQYNRMEVPAIPGPGGFPAHVEEGEAGPLNIETAEDSTVSGFGNGISVTAAYITQGDLVIRDSDGNEATVPGQIIPDPGIAGEVNVTVNGTVQGETGHGIMSLSTFNPTSTTINVGEFGLVEGKLDGILVRSMPLSALPTSGSAAVPLPFSFDQRAANLVVNNDGEIRNSSQSTTDVAIRSERTAATINNNGFIVGTVDLEAPEADYDTSFCDPNNPSQCGDVVVTEPAVPAGANHFVNMANGIWQTSGGTNEFGASSSADNTIVTEAYSTIVAADDDATEQVTIFNGVGTFTHGGELTLQDGGVGDIVQITDPSTGSAFAALAVSPLAAVVPGKFVANGGSLLLDTELAGDGAPSDLLVIDGDTTLGGAPVSISINNVGGAGAITVSNGIKVVKVNGESADGVFVLDGDYVIAGQQAVVAGAYSYTLWHNGLKTPTDGDWYLRSQLTPDPPGPPQPIYNPGVPVFEAYPQVLLGLNGLPTLQQRVGNRFWSGAGAGVVSQGADAVGEAAPQAGAPYVDGRGFWGRIEGTHANFDPRTSTSGTQYDFDTVKMQAGLDVLLHESDAGALIGGLTVQYGHASADVTSFYGDGDISTGGYGFGGTLTWYGDNGIYVDAQGQVSWYGSDLHSDPLGELSDGSDGFGYALSLEGGSRIALENGLTLTPQAQLVYSSVDFDSFTQTLAGNSIAHVSLLDGDSLRGRIGLALDEERSWQADNGTLSRRHVYGIANLYNEFLDGTAVNVAGVTFVNRSDRLWGGLGLGGSYNWNDDKFSLYGEASANTSLAHLGDSLEVKGTAGLRVKW